MPPYAELYAVGSGIRIADLPELEQFRATWRLHHPLSPEQLPFAGQSATVRAVSYYHGGDVLYELIGAPGIWHEQCLRAGSGARAV
jgi:hypothetical protein